MIIRKLTAICAAIFLVTISSQADAKRYYGVQEQFCGDRYCGQGSFSEIVRGRRFKRIATHKARTHRPTRVAEIKIKRPLDDLPVILQAFAAPVGVVCVKPMAIGANILNSFKERIANIIEPVRKGYVAIETGSGKKAIVADKAASKFVMFIRSLENTGYKIKDIGGYAYRRIAGTRHLSKHAFGLAIDINQIERDRVSVPMNRKQVSHIAASVGICSGGDWRNGDLGHFEICGSTRGKRKVRHTRYAHI